MTSLLPFFLLQFVYNSCLEGRLAELLSGILGSETNYVHITQISKEPNASAKLRERIYC